ncbi:hypothetical protein [Spiroplasma poulsonii]|uniref:hypothetical protein n=1 Tax=Spiroplasma poulsonii TaxID=2138 RepID=UPI001F4D0591|nr:hypothetical protein [Spiroplasma poulsonii]UNF62039.1 hypothetical protein MNU24_00820 [Spiroplasma poulsonii]
MIILMIKLMTVMLPKLQSSMSKNNLILVKEKHTVKTQVVSDRNQKLLQQVFRSEKTWLCFI